MAAIARFARVPTALAVSLCLAAPLCAQERAGTWYVQGGVSAVTEDGPGGETSVTYLTAPGGTTVGWLVSGGVFLGRHLSAEGEWATTGTMRAREASRYGMTFDEERRVASLIANVRVHLRPSAPFDVEPVVGAGIARHGGSSQTTYERPWLPPGQQIETTPRTDYDTVTTGVFSVGTDLRAGGSRVAVVPSVRWRWRAASEDLTARYPGGVPRWSFAAGVLLRVAIGPAIPVVQ
jgi:hypothetical protein